MKLLWKFQRGGEVLEKDPLCRQGINIFWNFTIPNGSKGTIL